MKINRRNFIKLLASVVIAKLPLKFVSKTDKFASSILNNKENRQNKPKVIRIYNPKATFWDYKTKPYTNFINENIVNQMLKVGLCTFTETKSVKEAWQKLMPTYKNGDKIAIKPNLNALHLGHEKNITATPTVINSVIHSLINDLGVPPSNIYVYDLCVNAEKIKQFLKYPVNCIGKSTGSILDRIKLGLHIGLNTSDPSACIDMRHPIYDTDGTQVYCYIPKVVTQANHLINIPILKAHQFVLITCAFKNHFGTVRFSNYNQYPLILHGEPLQPALVDIYKNKHINDKTRLIIVDGLFGAPLYGHKPFGRLPTPWHTFPGDKTPNSIFLATDPVAVESIIADYVAAEQTYHKFDLRPHDYLHWAAKENLGIHEHRKSDGSYSLIEYIQVKL